MFYFVYPVSVVSAFLGIPSPRLEQCAGTSKLTILAMIQVLWGASIWEEEFTISVLAERESRTLFSSYLHKRSHVMAFQMLGYQARKCRAQQQLTQIVWWLSFAWWLGNVFAKQQFQECSQITGMGKNEHSQGSMVLHILHSQNCTSQCLFLPQAFLSSIMQ